jgi:hypothetical protein
MNRPQLARWRFAGFFQRRSAFDPVAPLVTLRLKLAVECGLHVGSIEKRCVLNVSAEMNIEWLQGKRREKWHLRSHAVDILTFGLETPFSASKLAKKLDFDSNR